VGLSTSWDLKEVVLHLSRAAIPLTHWPHFVTNVSSVLAKNSSFKIIEKEKWQNTRANSVKLARRSLKKG
jgi:hypothetical protein